jgi:beta-lactamase superfamily II metal-dependent hydrolase
MLQIVVWDVQHGNAAYLRTPNGRHIVVDLGAGSYGSSERTFSPLLHLKYKWGVELLDGVIITHPHRDHLDDIFNFGELSPRVFTRPQHLDEASIRAGNQVKDREVIDKYLEINRRYNQPVQASDNPFIPVNNGGVQISRFFPRECSTKNLNNHSVACVVSYAGCKMVIPGDNEQPSWDELLKDQSLVEAIQGTHILLAPHHGREAGFSASLFKYFNPLLTVISDGRFCDTSATDRYDDVTQGWVVHKRSGGKEDRKCVTTRNDGVIDIKFGKNTDGKPFIEVRID